MGNVGLNLGLANPFAGGGAGGDQSAQGAAQSLENTANDLVAANYAQEAQRMEENFEITQSTAEARQDLEQMKATTGLGRVATGIVGVA